MTLEKDPITVTEVNKAGVAEVSCNEAYVKDPNSDVDGIMNNPMQRSFIEDSTYIDTELPKAAWRIVKSKLCSSAPVMKSNLIPELKERGVRIGFIPVEEKANDKQTKKKPAANDKASTSHASGEKSTLTSNAFDVLNSEEGAEFGDSNPIIKTTHVEGDAKSLKSGTEEAVKEQQKDNLWSKFKAAKEASKNNPRSSPVVEDSEEDEVYCSNAEYTSRVGSSFSMDEDDLDGYDGYEAQVYDIPERLQTYCDGFDIRLNSSGRK
ncbi:hypothetical protein Tco_0374942 [Tanacetum coccineum]